MDFIQRLQRGSLTTLLVLLLWRSRSAQTVTLSSLPASYAYLHPALATLASSSPASSSSSSAASSSTTPVFITSVSFLFEAFSPYGLVRFFEFSDKGWNVSENCLKDMYDYLEGLRRDALWAVKLYDASGYYGGGAFGGIAARLRFHNPQLCRQLRRDHEQLAWRLPRKAFWNATVAPFPVQIVMAQYALTLWQGEDYKLQHIQQLICLPQACGNADLPQVLEVHAFPGSALVTNITYMRHRIVLDDYNVYDDLDFYILVTFICSSLCIYAAIHALRFYIAHTSHTTAAVPPSPPPDEEASWTLDSRLPEKLRAHTYASPLSITIQNLINEKLPTSFEPLPVRNVNFLTVPSEKRDASGLLFPFAPHRMLSNDPTQGGLLPPAPHIEVALPEKIAVQERSHFLEDLLNVCSLENVLYRLFEADDAPESGLIVLFNMAMIYAHLSAELSFMAGGGEVDKKLSAHWTTYAIDIYFFVNAAKLAQQFWFQSPLRERLNVCQQLLHVFKLILQKIVCLVPSYTFCLFAEHLLGKHFQHNVALELPTYDSRNCHENKLSNLFYLDIFFPLEKRCMPWTWFISLEVQFYVIACVVLLLAEIQLRYALVIGAAIFATNILAATMWELRPDGAEGPHLIAANELSHFFLVYDNICLRAPAYVLGLCFGCIVQKSNSNVNLNVCLVTGGWLICCTTVGLFFWNYDWIYLHVNVFTRALVGCLTHVLWCLVLLWLLVTSVTPYGGWLYNLLCFKYSHTLERLTPICLLIAPTLVIRLFVFTGDTIAAAALPPALAGQQQLPAISGQMLILTIGTLFLTHLSALVLHVLLDGAISALVAELVNRS